MGVAEPGDTAVKGNGVVMRNGKPGDGERSFPTRGPCGDRQVLTGTQQGWGDSPDLTEGQSSPGEGERGSQGESGL